MSIYVSVKDMAEIKTMFRNVKGGANKVTSRAINKTLPGVRTDAVDEAAIRLNLTKTRIRKNCKLDKAYAKNPKGSFKSIGKPINLAEFSGTRKTKKGVSVKVKKTSKRTILKHAFFVETGANIHRVFDRMYRGKRTKLNPNVIYAKLPRRYRLPIEKLDGPRVEDILAAKEVMEKIMKKAGERYVKNINHEVDYLLSQQR